jgi:hypothetical protein
MFKLQIVIIKHLSVAHFKNDKIFYKRNRYNEKVYENVKTI